MLNDVKQAANRSRELVVTWIYDELGRDPVGNIKKKALNAVGKSPLIPVSFADATFGEHSLIKNSISTLAPPCGIGEIPKRSQSVFNDIHAYQMQDALCTPYATGVLRDNILALPGHFLENRGRFRTEGGGLFRFERGHCIGRIAYNEKVLERGILLGGAGSYNWYHFMIECLPKALLAQRLPERFSNWPLLVPIEAKNCATFSDALNTLIGIRPVIYLNYSEIVKVKNLVVFDEVSISPFNLRRSSWPICEDYSQNDEFLINYSRHLQDNLVGMPSVLGTQKRIFLVRPGVRRSYNQDEILDIAMRHGFQAVSPENMSLAEQAHLFSDAEMIIGPSGAAWVGAIFSNKPTRMLSWLPREYSQFCSYSNLAEILGHEMRFIYCVPDQPVKSTDDVYLSSYYVDPDVFIEALKWLENY